MNIDNCRLPLTFEPALYSRVWGDRRLGELFGKLLPLGNVPIGESWEIYEGNTIANGVFAGRRLGQIVKEFPQEILGDAAQHFSEFPLLTKLLSASEWLSVQVHPNDELAFELEGQQRGKSECWYILHADSDAAIIYGFTKKYTPEELRNRLEQDSAQDMLQRFPVKKGDVVYVPAGTIHAIGPGIVLYELQQSSDITYRLYDWGRVGLDGQPRELHLEKGLRCVNFELPSAPSSSANVVEVAPDVYRRRLTSCEYFVLDEIVMEQSSSLSLSTERLPQTITVVSGSIVVESGSGESMVLQSGNSALLPAILGDYSFVASPHAQILHARLPFAE